MSCKMSASLSASSFEAKRRQSIRVSSVEDDLMALIDRSRVAGDT